MSSGGKDLSKARSGCPSSTSEDDSLTLGENTNTQLKVKSLAMEQICVLLLRTGVFLQLLSYECLFQRKNDRL